MSVKARGNFMEVEEPKYAKTILGCDLNVNHKMIAVNGSTTDISPIGSDYNITINTYKVSGGYDGGCGRWLSMERIRLPSSGVLLSG